MAMKLQFEFDVRKADELLRTLNEIKKGFGDIDQGRGGFGKQFSEQIRTSTDHIQKLQEAMRSGGQGSKGLEDFVRVSEKAFGIQMRALVDAQTKSMESLKKEINSTADSINTLTRVYERLERQEDSIENKRKMRAVSTRMTVEQAKLNELQDVMQQAQATQAATQAATQPAGPGAWATMRAGAGSLMRGAAIGAGAAGGIMAAATVPGRLEDQLSLMQTTAATRRFQFETVAGEEALQGDITREALRASGFSHSGALERLRGGDANLFDAARAIGGAGFQNIRSLITGGPMVTAEEVARQRMQALEEADVERFQAVLGRGSQFRLEAGRALGGYEAAFGMAAGQRDLQGALGQGVTLGQAAPMMNIMAQFGVQLDDPREAGAISRYRLTENLVAQQARRRAFGTTEGGTVDLMGEILGAGGFEGHAGAGRTQLSQAIGGYLQDRSAAVTAESLTATMGAAMQMAQQGVAGGLTAEAAIGVATQTTMGTLGRFESGDTMENMLVREKLRSLGLNHAEREQVLRFGVGTEGFFQAISSYRPDLSAQQIRREFGSMMGEFEEAIAGFHAVDDDALIRQAEMGLIPGVDGDRAREMLSDPRQARRFRQLVVQDPASVAAGLDRQDVMEGATRVETPVAGEGMTVTQPPTLSVAQTTQVAEDEARAGVQAVTAGTEGARQALSAFSEAAIKLSSSLNELNQAYIEAQQESRERRTAPPMSPQEAMHGTPPVRGTTRRTTGE